MTLTERPRGSSSDSPTGSGRARGSPHLKCLTAHQRQYILAELHDRVCENHPGSKTLAHKAHTQEYYWLTMRADAAAYVKKCDRCQR